MRFTTFLLCTAACTFFAVPAVKAEIYQWGNPGISLTMTFPDTWRLIGNQQPDDVVTIAAPGDADYATCRLRVDEDRRFVIYPREFASAIQHKNFSNDFWKNYIGQYRAAELHAVGDDAGLGQGFASWADVSFVSPAGPEVQMRGLMFATVYNDNAYVFECSAESSAFDKWYHPFQDVLKSVDMRPEYSTTTHGRYRPFEKDGKWLIHGEKETDLFVY